MAYCSILEKHPGKIHLIAGVSTSTARLNILDCDGYGMMNFFEGRCRTGQYQNRDCLYVKTPTGEKIVLVSGGGKAGDERLIKGNTYGIAYITEANECHPDFIQEVFDRTISSPDRKIFHDLNPKPPNHWYYDILKFHEEQQAADPSYGYNYGHFTIADNMSISNAQLRQILKTYDKTTVWYARDIKGERRAAEGLVYPMFGEARHVLSKEPDTDGEYYVSGDYGIQNPNVFLLWRKERLTKRWICLREDYYSGRDERHQLTDAELVDRLDAMLGGIMPKFVILDPSASSMKAALQRRGYHVWDANNDVLDGISDVATMLHDGQLGFMECCKNTIAEFGSYFWDEKAADAGVDAPLKQSDHCLTGDTLVETVCGQVRIDELVGKIGCVYCTNGKRKEIGVFHDVRMTQKEAEVFEVTLSDGRSVKATADHPILTRRGWVQIKDLRGDDEIACIGGNDDESRVQRGQENGVL